MKSRSGTPRGPRAGRLSPARALALLVCILLLGAAPACSKAEDDENVIQDIVASLQLDPEPSTVPAVFFRETSPPANQDGSELVFVDVVLNAAASPLTYDTVTLEVRFNPGVLQFAGFAEGEDSICSSAPASTCTTVVNLVTKDNTICVFNGIEANNTGTLTGFVGLPTNLGCTKTLTSEDHRIVTLGFAAQAPITPVPCNISVGPLETAPPGCIVLIEGPGHGDSEVLLDLVDLGVPFFDRNAAVSAVRQ